MDVNKIAEDNLIKQICGEIVLSTKPGLTVRKWRNIFKISQRELADELRIMPSVISDYESGRRTSPGIKIIQRFVEALVNIDNRRGGRVLREFYSFPSKNILSSAVLDIKEFTTPVNVKDFCKEIKCRIMVREDLGDRNIYGYTIVDAIKAIIELSPTELVNIYGLTTDRALIFTNVSSGRSPMVALKVTNLKPNLVVFQGPKELDEIALRIGEVESIPVALTRIENAEELMKTLKRAYP
ncbi:MAG: helix-turn-helix domain-containing protein [Candidatus Aenigmatarchaeota archaeon]|nr:MAG: helix-turn-helix domain-containing protein [Candidatus Aenigmarchaeota archaeon]